MSINRFLIILLILFLINAVGNTSEKNTPEEGKNDMIVNIWQQYINYWTGKDKELVLNIGDSTEEIEQFENDIGLKLPEEFQKSLLAQYHFSRRGKDGLRYSWFGDKIETNFLSIQKIREEYEHCLQDDSTNEINSPEGVRNIYIGNVTPYSKKGWSKYWVPILVRYDVDLIVFLDLRPNLDKSNYGSVLVILPLTEEKGDDWHTRIALVSNSYESFMREALEYLRSHDGLDDNYFLTQLQLPSQFWE